MRLVVNSRNCNSGSGLNRYKGKGIFSFPHRKNTSLRKVTNTDGKDEACVGLDKKLEGKGIDTVDSSNIDESGSDEESLMETISNFTEEEPINDDEESNIDNKEEIVHNNEDNNDIENKEEIVHNNEENVVNDVNLKRKFDKETQKLGVEYKYPPSIVDFLINNNKTDDSALPVPAKLQCLDQISVSDCQESYVPSIAEPQLQLYLTNHDSRNDVRMSENSKNHHLSLIYPTKGKKWPQKKCVNCRRKYGVRNDTRYICMQCNVALCKEPCFSDYHCNK